MAGRSSAAESVADASAVLQGKKTVELKKKLLLSEGQKKAYVGDWVQREKHIADTLAELKKEIKQLTEQITQLNNESWCRRPASSAKSIANHQSDPAKICAKKLPVVYPIGARSAEDAVRIYDAKLIQLIKQRDLLTARYAQRKAIFERLYAKYVELQVYRQSDGAGGATGKNGTPVVPTSAEEEENLKQVCHLENEILRTNAQWMEAEHIRKKYLSIKASLCGDAEKFEKSLREMEAAMAEQQTDIERIQEINHEALQMRDTTKVALLRQEHAAHVSAKSRDRQAFEFRRQVEERKTELEKLERKLFATGKPLLHHGSVDSLNGGDPLGAGAKSTPVRKDSTARAEEATTEMEQLFKQLMEMTGATTAPEVLERFLGQKESSSRLAYLRTVTEGEKKRLEQQRALLSGQLEAHKFSNDGKENEESQEEVDQLKLGIEVELDRAVQCDDVVQHTAKAIESIKSTLLDLILELQEVDEVIDPPGMKERSAGEVPFELAELLAGKASDETLLHILEDKFKKGLTWSGDGFSDPGNSEIAQEELLTPKPDELDVRLPSSTGSTVTHRPPTSMLDEKERPQAFPACYSSLMVGRSTGHMSSASPGQLSQSVATDDEVEVPTRGYLKRQAQNIVDAKSRRKGFRAPKR